MAEVSPSRRGPDARHERSMMRALSAMVPTVIFVGIAITGWMTTRAARVATTYASLNPVSDRELWQRICEGTATAEELESSGAMGSPLAAETLYLPPPVVLRILSLGHPSAVADLLFVRVHSYFLSHFFADRRFEWLDAYISAIVALDPDNPKVYLWAAQVLKMSQMLDDGVILHANRFLSDGIERFPNDWRLRIDLGFNLFFELKGANDEEKAANHLAARDHFAAALSLPGSPLDPNFVAELFERKNQGELATTYALQKYYEASPAQRTQLLRRIGALSEVLAKGLKDEEARWRADWPFLPIALFSLVDEGAGGEIQRGGTRISRGGTP
jgi:hypothetical protein